MRVRVEVTDFGILQQTAFAADYFYISWFHVLENENGLRSRHRFFFVGKSALRFGFITDNSAFILVK